MGKKLCAITLVNEDLSIITGATVKDENLIKKLIIGDIVYLKGKIHYDIKYQKTHKNLLVSEIIFLDSPKKADQIELKRKKFLEMKNSKEENKNKICYYFKKNRKCPDTDCKLRHFFINDDERNYYNKNNERKIKMYSEAHEGDILNKEELECKSHRNSFFADFLVEKFGINNLLKGTILDIAGGRGLVSYYLVIKYNLNCKIVDPRGAKIGRKYIKSLAKNNKKIEEDKKFFNLETCKDLINGCSLIIGMHPDEATVDIIDVALKYKINFAVVPCCVFFSKFRERKLKNGKEVKEYVDLIQYILEKDENLKVDFLNIKGRNKIIYKIF